MAISSKSQQGMSSSLILPAYLLWTANASLPNQSHLCGIVGCPNLYRRLKISKVGFARCARVVDYSLLLCSNIFTTLAGFQDFVITLHNFSQYKFKFLLRSEGPFRENVISSIAITFSSFITDPLYYQGFKNYA